MGLLCAVLMMVAIFAITWTVSRWDAKTAYRLFEHSQHFFEPEVDSPVTPVKARIRDNPESSKRSSERQYISPINKKRVAAKQKWRCGACRQLLDETFEIDHRTPLFRGGHPTQEGNLQALCKRCHMFKSALEQARS